MSKMLEDKNKPAEVIAHDVEPLVVDTDPRRFSKLGWFLVLAGFGVFVLWAAFAPLDRGVPLSGYVAKESNRQVVQNAVGGSVQEILVKDGDIVKQGQVLVRLNPVVAKAQADVNRSQYYTARAAEARLLAERDGRKSVAFPPELKGAKEDPRVTEVILLQEQLFTSRQASLQSELSAMEESIAGLKSQLQGTEESRESKRAQVKLLKEQLDGMRDLAKDGYVARNRLLELERTYAQLNGAISEDIGNIGRIQRQISELGLRRIQRQQEFQREVRSQLADVQKEAESLGSRMEALEFEESAVEVKSPVAGVVTNLKVYTRGAVLPQGFQMMEVVPTGDAMVVEGRLAVNLVDKVHPGLPVELIFSAFNASTTPHIPGEVINVAADRTVDERDGQPYYLVRARVTPAGAKLIAQNKLAIQPGMPVDLFVKTGERTMMSYLFKPIIDRAHVSMSED
jgi:protease secretion system membrane fusion protein